MRSVMKTREFETDDSFGKIKYGLQYLRGNKLPYFSVTVEGYYKTANGSRRTKRDFDFCGCSHDQVLATTPDLKPLVDLHLSDANGVPMHAEANGWYWLAGALGGLGEMYHGGQGLNGRAPEVCRQVLGKHLRVAAAEVDTLCREYESLAAREGLKAARGVWARFIEDQRPRWRAEADAAIEAFGLNGWDR